MAKYIIPVKPNKLFPGIANVLVSKIDFERVSKLKWHLTDSGYAARYMSSQEKQKHLRTPKSQPVPKAAIRSYLHREIFALKSGRKISKGLIIDHANVSKQDNRRVNLRPFTFSQNAANRAPFFSPNKKASKYKGVRFDPRHKTHPWIAVIGNKQVARFKKDTGAAWRYNAGMIKKLGKVHRSVLNDVTSRAKERGLLIKKRSSKSVTRKVSAAAKTGLIKVAGYTQRMRGKAIRHRASTRKRSRRKSR